MNSYHEYDFITMNIYKTGVSNIELERIISKDYYYSYLYALEVLKGRFGLGEEAISKNGSYSWGYAFYVLKGRFRLGEKIIVKNACCEYLVKVLGYNHE